MVYSVQALLVFASAATRDARLAQAQSLIQSRPRWGATDVLSVEDPPNALVVETRYETRAALDHIRGQLQALDLQPGSWVRWHDCTHDEGDNVCVPDGYWAVP